MPKEYGLVAKKSLNFVLTHEDIETNEFTGDFEKDKTHINKINKQTNIEQRFFRYRKSFKWNSKNPFHNTRRAGKLYPEYILLKHYQWRSPTQMQTRVFTRQIVAEKNHGHGGFGGYTHDKTWKFFLCKPENAVLADSDAILRKLADELPYRSFLDITLRRRIATRLKLYFTLYTSWLKNKTN